MTKPVVFISYSREDSAIKDRVVSHLRALDTAGSITVLDDTALCTGDDWRIRLSEIVDRASVALLLISSDFLASDSKSKKEVPFLLERREDRGLTVIPVIVRPCAWTSVPWLRRIQAWPRDGRAIFEATTIGIDRNLAELSEFVAMLLKLSTERALERGSWKLDEVEGELKTETEQSAKGHIFVSHSRDDGDFAELVKLRLKDERYMAWIDLERLPVGEDWRAEIDSAIKAASVMIIIMTPEARQSEYVTYEWAFALGLAKPLIPILLKSTQMHPRLESLQYLDFTKREARPWRKLSVAIKEALRKETRE